MEAYGGWSYNRARVAVFAQMEAALLPQIEASILWPEQTPWAEKAFWRMLPMFSQLTPEAACGKLHQAH